jgi:hypothetical protein
MCKMYKSALKKTFAQKTDFLGLKLFLGTLFTKVICTFLKSVEKDRFFDAPFDLFKEKKSFHLLEGTTHFFEN